MSDRPSITNVERAVADVLGEPTEAASQQSLEAVYRIDPQTKVPVSKKHGAHFKSMLEAAQRFRQNHVEAWNEALRYYNHDQMEHRSTDQSGRSGNRYFAMRRNPQWSETENVVYANTSAIMPAVYAKNPQAEFTPHVALDDEANAQYRTYIQLVEDVVNKLAETVDPPGINLKAHAYQATLSAEVMNLGWIETGYTTRANSSVEAQALLQDLSKQLAEAKDVKTVREIEGKLMALEESVDVLSPPGPYVKYHPPQCVIPDANTRMPDFSDARVLFIEEFYPTSYLNAKYGEKSDDGSVKSIYEPTHVLLPADGEGNDVKDMKLFDTNANAPSAYGFRDQAELDKACMTRCWRILDKTTRRVYLYADNSWRFPIWAENDPYGLPGFFNLDPLCFNRTPSGAYARSNVTYYLDQQDALNEIHDEFRRARQDMKENILYDEQFDRESVTKWLTGSGPNAYGVKVPEGKTLKDMILEKPNALLKAAPLYDVGRVLQSIDRVSGVSESLRGAQYKTNTTNKAIENYNSSTALRLDAKIDAIEDFLGRVLFKVGFMCCQFMTQQEVAQLVGAKRAEAWRQFEPNELRMLFTCRVVGGSTQKPTSQAKKQQAIEISRVLAQFAQFAPATVLETTMTVLSEAFEEVMIPEGTFDRIRDEAAQAMRRGDSVSGGGQGPRQAGNASSSGDQLAQLAQLIDSLPPQAKLALGEAIARGIPIAEALPEVLSAVNPGGTMQ